MNNSGLVVGTILDASFNCRVVIVSESGTVVDDAICQFSGAPVGVNASGQVVGSHFTPDGQLRAFIWSQASGFTDLPRPAYALDSRAFAINDTGQIAGSILLGVLPNIVNAIRWTPNGFLDLGRISDQAYGTGINTTVS